MFAPKTVIEGLRGVGRVELAFEEGQRAYVLLGQNAVGKTKTLEALFQVALFAYLSKNGRRAMFRPELQVFGLASASEWRFGAPSRIPGSAESEYLVEEALGADALPCVFAGAQGRGFIDHSQGKAPPLGTFEQRRNGYIQSVFHDMRTSFSSLGMGNGIEHWFVARAQSANRYQRTDDSREVEIQTVLELMHRIDERVDPDFLEISGDESVTVKVAGESRRLDQLSSGFASVLKLVQAIVAGYASFTNDRALRDMRGRVFIDEIERRAANRRSA